MATTETVATPEISGKAAYKARLNALIEEFRAMAPHGITEEDLWREIDAALDEVRIERQIERRLDQLEEEQDIAEIERRDADPEGPSVPWEEVKAQFGL
jgi:hypothetical protein